jgi:hypothetical protein
MDQSPLSAYPKLDAYREHRPDIFQSKGAADWFVRCHRAGLVKAGALVMLQNQWRVHPQKFDDYVLQAAHDAAARHIGRQSEAAQ